MAEMEEGVDGVKKEGEANVPPKKKHEDVETRNLEKVTDYDAVEDTHNSEELGKVEELALTQ